MPFKRDVNNGNVFEVSGYEYTSNNDEILFAATTPNTKNIHLGFIVRGSQDFTVDIFENADISDGETATPINLNRRSSKTSTLAVAKNPTVNSEGTLLFGYCAGNNSNTGNVDNRGQIALKKNTTYLYKIKSKDNANRISYSGIWTEK